MGLSDALQLQDLKLRVWGLGVYGFRVEGLGVLGFWVQGFGGLGSLKLVVFCWVPFGV